MADDLDRVCLDSGYLVGGRARVGQAYERQLPAIHEVIGCARLRCTICREMVANVPGAALARSATARTAYRDGATLDPGQLTSAPPWARLYCCRCTSWLETSRTAAAPPASFDALAPVLPWRCAGHARLAAHVDEVDQHLRAEAVLRTDLAPDVPPSRSADMVMLMWDAAEPGLRGQLADLVRGMIGRETGRTLARALAVTEVEPAAFRDALAGVAPDDARFAAPDETRQGWRLCDRLAATVAACIKATGDWARLSSLARALFPDTESKALVRIVAEHDPDTVVVHYVRHPPQADHASAVGDWRMALERIVANDAVQDAADELTRRIDLAGDPIAARVAAEQALDAMLAGWAGDRGPGPTLRLLQLIERVGPLRGFSRTLELFARPLPPDVARAALRALRGYYHAPPKRPEPAFDAYLHVLLEHRDDPEASVEAWESLLALERPEVAARAPEFVRHDRMGSLIVACLRTRHRRAAREALEALYNACLAVEDLSGEHEMAFTHVVALHGWTMHANQHQVWLRHHGTSDSIILAVKPQHLKRSELQQYQWASQGRQRLSDWLKE